ncbi:hypothetical protein Tco_0736043 [Tanacetum coccineum]
MESLHLSFSRAVEAGIFKGYKIDPSTTLSHLFYADDAKSHLLGVGIPDKCVSEAAKSIGCLIMKAPFKYLGILVGDNMYSKKAWDEMINKMKKRLSRNFFNGFQEGDRKIVGSNGLSPDIISALHGLNGHVLLLLSIRHGASIIKYKLLERSLLALIFQAFFFIVVCS